MDTKLIFGILGGIGAGKSAAAACFSHLGCGIIHADRIAHEVLARPEMVREITQLFGPEVLSEGGDVDRKKLADVVFCDPQKLDRLNKLIHPPVLACCEEKMERFQRDPSVTAIVLDIPLLVETGWEKRCDVLIFVECSEQNRAKRMQKKGVVGIEQQKKREIFQISLDKKKKMAQYTLDNNSDESELAKQVEAVFSAIRDRR